MVRVLSVYNNKSLLVSEIKKKLTWNRDAFTSRASVVADYDHSRERTFFVDDERRGWMKNESKDEFFKKSFYGYPGSWKESTGREGLVMWESYVNCGWTECPSQSIVVWPYITFNCLVVSESRIGWVTGMLTPHMRSLYHGLCTGLWCVHFHKLLRSFVYTSFIPHTCHSCD